MTSTTISAAEHAQSIKDDVMTSTAVVCHGVRITAGTGHAMTSITDTSEAVTGTAGTGHGEIVIAKKRSHQDRNK